VNRIKISPQVGGRVDIVPFLCGLLIIRPSPFFNLPRISAQIYSADALFLAELSVA